MSILIKGAKMPKNCKDCDLYRHCDVPFSEEYFKRDSGRPSDCPLIEIPLIEIPPHGDLIDEDKLINVLFDLLDNSDKPVHDMLLEVETAPTVIESEEQEHE